MAGWWRHVRGVGMACWLLAVSKGLSAQDRPAGSDGFVPVPAGELAQEVLPATPLVFSAYALVWVVLVAYVFILWRRMTAAERDLKDLQNRLQTRR